MRSGVDYLDRNLGLIMFWLSFVIVWVDVIEDFCFIELWVNGWMLLEVVKCVICCLVIEN